MTPLRGARAWVARAGCMAGLLVLAAGAGTAPAAAQAILQQPAEFISMVRGSSLLLTSRNTVARFSIGDPTIADVKVISPTELVLDAKALGSTSLILWEAGVAAPKLYTVEVTVDAAALERYLEQVLPGEDLTVTSSGNSITLSGTVKDPNSVARALDIARATGVTSVIDNLVAPPAVQVLLQVRFAEINRSSLKDFSSLLSTFNPQNLDSDGDWNIESVSDGLLRIMLSNPTANIEALFTGSTSRGLIRTLAQPNLLTLPGKEATFLAGGEFPYPSVQAGGTGANNAVAIVFKEFGIRLKFTPNITRSGAIRLRVEPEVSTLDFANGLVISGFSIPSLLTRRAMTEVELGEGQWLALAGLIDNTTLENVTKIPILGDIPILGQFFRSTNAQSRQTELLVLVTPRLIRATDGPPPALPTGEPITWKWPGWMRRALEQQPPTPPQG